jgi:cytochrome c-type biogenesis protein CcmH
MSPKNSMTYRRLSTALAAGLLLAAALAGSRASAYTLEEFQFDNPAQEQQFRELTGKLRCLVCQNESLAASQSDVAQDLRMKVYGMMRDGKDQDAIIAFLVDRYGDFVLYQPPFKPSTYLLWIGPFLLVGLGGFFLLRALMRKKTEPEQSLSAAEHARIDQLLAAGGDSKDPAK